MATIQNPAGFATPVGASLGRLASMFAQLPGPYENEARQATAEAARALAAERRIKTEESRNKMRAQGNLGALFARGMAPPPEMPLGPDQMGPNPQMTPDAHVRSIVPELYSEGAAAGFDPAQLGQLAFQMFKMGGASDQQAGQAYPKLIGVNDAVSLPDRENVAARNQQGKIAEIFAKPHNVGAGDVGLFAPDDPRFVPGGVRGRDTESTATGAIVNRAAAGEALPPLAAAIAGGMDKAPYPGAPAKGTPNIRNWTARGQQGRTLDGLTDMTTGQPIPADAAVFTGQVNASDSGGLTRAVQTDMQKSQMAVGRFNALLNQTVDMANRDPMNFGVPGFVKGGTQDIAVFVHGITDALGYKAPEEAINAARANLLANPGIQNPTVLSGLFDPNLPALRVMSDLLTYQAAAALAGQSGRDISDRDLTIMQRIVGDPTEWTMSQQKFLAKLATLRDIVKGRQGADAAMTGGGSPQQGAAPVVRWGRDAAGNPIPVQ